jgi:EmrB/QacA subfamily drug resistance transporter
MKTDRLEMRMDGAGAVAAASGRGALAGLALSMLLASLGTSAANVALPDLAVPFGATFQAVQWVVLAYLLAITTLIVSVGRLGDLTGRRRLLLAGLALFAGASVVGGAAPTLALLLAARALQGTGAAVMMALTLAFVADVVPRERTGRAMGLLGTMSAVGTALGPSLGGLLIAGPGWRAIFFINLPLGLVALYLARRHLPQDVRRADAPRPAFDIPGTLLLAGSLGAYALAITLGRGHFGGLNLALLVAAAAGVALFVAVERRAASPLVALAMFRDRLLAASLGTSLLVSAVVMATLVVGPFYLAGALGLDAAQVGLVVSVGPVVAALVGMPAGRLADRFGAQPASIAGLTGMSVGAVLLAALPAALGVAGYVVPIAILTASYALFQTANNTAALTAVGPDQRGAMSGMLNLSRNLGLVTGAAVMGAVFAAAVGVADIAVAAPEAVAAGMRQTFGVATGLLVVALAMAVRARRCRPGA